MKRIAYRFLRLESSRSDWKQFAGFMLLLFTCAIVVANVIARAWTADDAYITFRVLENFLDGYGLRWNIDERVQVYTHPLWMLVQLPLYALVREPLLPMIGNSVICIAAMMVCLSVRYKHMPWALLLCFALPYICSNALRDFSTSGLENPLTFLLLTLHFLYLTRSGKPNYFVVGLLTALVAWNRLDCLLLVFFPVLLLFLRRWDRKAVAAFLTGMLPLFAWFGFALLYYGFILPNTYYSKLNTGIGLSNYMLQGFIYLESMLLHDAMGSFLMLSSVPLAGYILASIFKSRPPSGNNLCHAFQHKDAMPAAWALSIIIYLLYIITAGGDFMVGRFFTAPALVGLLLCMQRISLLPLRTRRKYCLPYFLLLSFLAIQSFAANANSDKIAWKSGIANEFVFYRETSWIWNKAGKHPHDHIWAQWGKLEGAKAIELPDDKYHVIQFNNMGLYGYYNHPKSIIIDGFALTNPLLSRLPAQQDHWRIGHFLRTIPQGYMHIRTTNQDYLMQRDLAVYYKVLRTITSAPLLDPERLKMIYLWQWGYYDHYMQDYLDAQIRATMFD